MKRVAVVAALTVAGCEAQPEDVQQPPPRPPLSSFEFRGLVPDLTTMAEAIETGTVRDCSDDGSCDFAKHSVGDVGTGRSMVIFTNGKFDWFSVKMSPRAFEDMARTLNDAYGEPCRVGHKTLQNAFGATFSGDEVEWCFKEGRLTLRRHSENDVTEGELDFFTAREQPPAKSYKPGTL